MNKHINNKINNSLIFQSKDGAIRLKSDFKRETIWARQEQISSIFGINRTVVGRHIKNLLTTQEINEKRNVQKMHIPNSDKPVRLYDLDVILSIGYRTNSVRAIEFRKWATKVLKQHITKGFTINKAVIGKNFDFFMKAVDEVKTLLPESGTFDSKSALELVKLFANTWFSLSAYDHAELPTVGATLKQVKFTANELSTAVFELKDELLKQKDANANFAAERSRNALEGIVGNVFQSFGGKDVYPSLESKAAHLLYFVVKNHPFVDGNKRTGAFTFVWFLKRAKLLDFNKLTPVALTALTLLVAESNPKEKDKIIGLVLLLINKK